MNHARQALRTLFRHLLPSTYSVSLTKVTMETDYVTLQLTTTALTACCPCCAVPLWSAKLSLAYPHLRLFEALEFPIDLVHIKGLRIKLATDPCQHLLMLGVLRILYRVQKVRVTPDATAI